MRVLAIVVLVGGAAGADAKPLDAKGAVAGFVPGMAEADARQLAHRLGCETIDDHAAGQLDCSEGPEPTSGSWVLSFEHARLDHVEYRITVPLDASDAVNRKVRHQLEARAAQWEAAVEASGGVKARVAVHDDSIYSHVHASKWVPSKRRESKILVTSWTEQGKSDELEVQVEIVAPAGELGSYLVTDPR